MQRMVCVWSTAASEVLTHQMKLVIQLLQLQALLHIDTKIIT